MGWVGALTREAQLVQRWIASLRRTAMDAICQNYTSGNLIKTRCLVPRRANPDSPALVAAVPYESSVRTLARRCTGEITWQGNVVDLVVE